MLPILHQVLECDLCGPSDGRTFSTRLRITSPIRSTCAHTGHLHLRATISSRQLGSPVSCESTDVAVLERRQGPHVVTFRFMTVRGECWEPRSQRGNWLGSACERPGQVGSPERTDTYRLASDVRSRHVHGVYKLDETSHIVSFVFA